MGFVLTGIFSLYQYYL